MTSSISAISGSLVGTSSSGSSTALTDVTKKKLEALGIDTTNIKTESDGQAKLQEAQAAQAAAQHQGKHHGTNPMESIEDGAKSLAAQMDIAVGTKDDIGTVFSNISTKIEELQASAGDDQTKKSEVDGYQKQYDTLYREYSQAMAAKKMTGASALANYNKAALGLS